MHNFDSYSHEYKTRRIFELWINSCYGGLKNGCQFCRATIWSSPIDMNELVGCGLVSAVIWSFAAYMAASCADTLGILQWVGKNSTVSQIHVPCVFGI